MVLPTRTLSRGTGLSALRFAEAPSKSKRHLRATTNVRLQLTPYSPAHSSSFSQSPFLLFTAFFPTDIHPSQMSFTITLRQGPSRLATRLPHLTRTQPVANPSSIASRSFHQSARRQNACSPSKLARPTAKSTSLVSRLVIGGSKRGYQYQAGPAADNTSTLRKLAVGGAIFGGTIIAINAVFNRETREDGGMPPFERSYLNETFMHTGLGVGIIGLTARQMVQSGFVYRLMMTNPWVVGIGGLALSFGTMIATRSIEPEK